MQLVGEVMGQVSDALDRNKTPGFDETNVTNDWGRIILEAAGSAAVAGVTGGNVGSAAASSAVSTATIAATGQYIADNALSLAGGDKEVATILTNIGMNIAASGAGAAAGAATGGSSGAINGASIASDLQQYNAAGGKLAEKLIEVALKAAQKAAQLSGSKTLINLTKNIDKIDDVVDAIEHSAVGKKIEDAADAINDAGFKAADKVKNIVEGSDADAVTLDPNEVRFSQNTVSYNKTDRVTGENYTYDDLVNSMKKDGWKGDPVDIVEMPDGDFTSMDNTRISAAREAGIKIKANTHLYSDPLPEDMIEINRFKGAETWGEAMSGRINKQTGGFNKNNPYGSNDLPRITGKK